ncbi:hypothetical protein BU25DRAFT_459231 [Macroventuria anomochaeta]|uniref:Uncharacterized protein n=1 Tax=Macroventuria anomochaeta TaxID=301207 RepID=A0ACB6RWW5_9PLEO|nr:uncharacterized protein BU25DRAFT_459231 [Macroventuria anomochaeta]KAF2626526.1 hypothetical protein BU25DRAFT_459231 [Macroventuria anomochaeta]
MAKTPYKYIPLDSTKEEIRLLYKPKSDAKAGLIKYSLCNVSLQDTPEFTALSYHWGRQSHDRPITINGTRTHITQNLETALHHVDGGIWLIQAVPWFYRLFWLFISGGFPDHTADSEVMSRLITTFYNFGGPVPTTILDLRNRSQHNSEFSLRSFLGLTNIVSCGYARGIDASDDRDRAYTLLGVTTDDAARDIVPDYTLSCHDVYIRTAQVLLRHGHYDIPSLCRGQDRNYSLPSWVPDWSTVMEQP